MAEIGKVRIRLPSNIKQGSVVRARALIIHPMEILSRDKEKKIIPKNYLFVNKVVVTYNGKEILQAELTQAVSENPFFAFPLKVTGPGTLKMIFTNTHGETYEGTAEVKVAS